MGVGQNGILQAHLFEHAKNIRAQLNTCANFAKFGCLLKNSYGKALVCERVGGNKPADAASGDQKGGGATIRTRHRGNLAQGQTRSDHKTWQAATQSELYTSEKPAGELPAGFKAV